MADPITRAAEAFWVSAPLRIQRRFGSTRGIVGDWHGIALAPPLAVLAPVLVVATYFAVGALTIGYDEVYSESLVLMASLVALGAASGQLGLIGLASFAFGDFFFANSDWALDTRRESVIEALIRLRVPLVIAYLLLAVGVLLIPRLAKSIALGVGQWRRIPKVTAWLVVTPVTVVVSWLGLRAWAALGPTLIRPIFVWSGGVPTTEAIEVFQDQASDLIAAGVAATVARQAVLGLFIYIPKLADALDALEARAHLRIMAGEAQVVPSPTTTGRRLVADLSSALLASLVLSGILETRRLWAVVFVVFATVRTLRSGTVRLNPVEQWKQIANRVPVVVRLGIAWLGAVVLRSVATEGRVGSYRGMAVVVLIGVVVFFFVFPGRPRPDGSSSETRQVPEAAPPLVDADAAAPGGVVA